jgi:hypothetical protein
VHGTFPPRRYEEGQGLDIASFWTSLAFAVLPLVLAAFIACIEHGRAVKFEDVVGILSQAVDAAPL